MSLQIWLPLTGDILNRGMNSAVVVNSNVTWAPDGKCGQCASFNGSSSRLSITNFSIGNNWSYGFWSYSTQTSRGWEALVVLNNNSGDADTQLGIFINTSGNRFQTTANGQYNSQVPYSYANKWTHYFATFNGSTLITYINGVKVDEKAITNGLLSKPNLTIGARSGSASGGASSSALFFLGKINDVRVYDTVLSQKEIKEIASGLFVHYKLDDPYIEPSVNLLSHPEYSGTYSPAWDASLHQGAIQVTGWSAGYNGGVPSPAVGYHAYWKLVDGAPTMIYPNINSTYNQKGRWLGISSNVYWFIPKNATYTVSMDIMTVEAWGTTMPYLYGGMYYVINSSTTSRGFHDGYKYFGNSKLGVWERISGTYTRSSSYDNSYVGGYETFYLYGGSSNEGIMYARNVQLEVLDHDTGYIIKYPLSAGPNLITSIQAGGNTSVSGLNVTTQGQDKDTYFFLNLSQPMILGHTYLFETTCSNMTQTALWNFPIAAQSNSDAGVMTLKNGYCHYIFEANSVAVNSGTQIILDDVSCSTSRAMTATFSNWSVKDVTPIVYDSSGMGNNGWTYGAVIPSKSGTPRYSSFAYFNSPYTTIYTNANRFKAIVASIPFQNVNALTISFWVKIESIYASSGLISISNNAFPTYPVDYSTGLMCNYDAKFTFVNSSGTAANVGLNYTANVWQHHVLSYDGSTIRYYRNGESITNVSLAGPLKPAQTLWLGFNDAGSALRTYKGGMSDFRVYGTALDANQVMDLYHTSSSIDRNGNYFSRELKE